MHNAERFKFLNAINGRNALNDNRPLSKEDQLKAISTTRVSNIAEFDALFNATVERQQKAKQERLNGKKNEKLSAVIKDDMFDELDKEFGF